MLSIKIRLFNTVLLDCVEDEVVVSIGVGLVPGATVGESESEIRLMYDKASVKAPATIVVVVDTNSDAVVEDISWRRLCKTSASTRAKGRYLFASEAEEDELEVPFSVVG